MTLEAKKGNAFEGGGDAVVVTINCVGAMGRGIALECKQRMPWLYTTYRRFCNRGAYSPGQINFNLGVFEGCKSKSEGRCNHESVILLPTKMHWKHPSRLEWIESGIQDLAELAIRKGFKHVDMTLPGGCNGWIKDKRGIWNILENHLKDHECLFTVHFL